MFNARLLPRFLSGEHRRPPWMPRLAGMNFKFKIISASRRNQQAGRLCSPETEHSLHTMDLVGVRPSPELSIWQNRCSAVTE